MPRGRTNFWICAGMLVVCFSWQARVVSAAGLDKYLKGQPLAVGSVKFIPVTLRDGMESRKSPSWPLKSPSKIFEEPFFQKNEKRALNVGIHLKEELDKYSVVGYKDHSFFFLFYDFITAAGCPNDYVIQKVKLTKSYYDFSGSPYKQEEQFLVEALALNFKKETKRADEHQKEYLLGKFHSRKIVIDLEIGCGQIPKVIEGRAWPFTENQLYHSIQNYSDQPGLYNKVNFSFSSRYRVAMEFDRDGKYSLELLYGK
jgi:hypothetical protein